MLRSEGSHLVLKETNKMSIIKTALVAAAFVAVTAAAHAQGREDLNSGYHGNTPVWNSPYGPRDEIQQSAREAFGQERAPVRARAPRARSR
jgi:hypothetical protein